MALQFGRTKWYDPVKGYGFITPLQGVNTDVFVHFNDLLSITETPMLSMGEYVQYEIGSASDDSGRTKATNVTGINGNSLLCDNGRVTIRPYGKSRPEEIPRPSIPDDTKFYLGCVKWYRPDKGFGFITPIDEGVPKDDVFVYYKDVFPKYAERSILVQGEYVTYSLGEADNIDGTSKHKYKATLVTGVYGNELLCDNGFVSYRPNRRRSQDEGAE